MNINLQAHSKTGEEVVTRKKGDSPKRQGNWNPWQAGTAMPLSERVADKYVVNPVTGCWDWTAQVMATGYGQVGHNVGVGKVKNIKAHIAVWTVHRGPIPSGQQLDHICRNPGCVNPGHLQLVTIRQNVNRQWLGRVGWAPQCV